MGYVITAIPKRVITFTYSPVVAGQELVLADRVDVLHWREITLALRVHTHTLGGQPNPILINIYAQSVSDQDPGLEFLDKNFQTVLQLDNTTPIPCLMEANLGDGQWYPSYGPPMVRITAQSTQTASGTISATISADIAVKDF